MNQAACNPSPTVLRLGDVARIAGAPAETIRSRVRSGVFDLREPQGWRAFSLADASAIALHAALKRETGDDTLAASILAEMAPRLEAALAAVPAGDAEALQRAVAADLFAVCARDAVGRWSVELAEGPFAADAALARRCAESYDATPIFLTCNIGAVLRGIAARILATPAAVAAAAPPETSNRSRAHA